ncbi:hypothetical protein GGD83_003764 [Rhodoblastus sphagnicola]|nr:hypothetical protein [Rhodoblastus sphagnicola]
MQPTLTNASQENWRRSDRCCSNKTDAVVSDHYVHAPWTNGGRCSSPRRPSVEILRPDRSHSRVVGSVSDSAADGNSRRLAILAGSIAESHHRLPSFDVESFLPMAPESARRGVSASSRRTGGGRSCMGRGGTHRQAKSDAGRGGDALASCYRACRRRRQGDRCAWLVRKIGSGRPHMRVRLRRTFDPFAPHRCCHAAFDAHGATRCCDRAGCGWTGFNLAPQRDVVGKSSACGPGGARSAGGAGRSSRRMGIDESRQCASGGRLAFGLGRSSTDPDRKDGRWGRHRRAGQVGRRHTTGRHFKAGG